MKRWMKRWILSITLIVSASVLAGPSGGDFEITNSSVNAGGGTAAGGAFDVGALAGQHEPGYADGGAYEIYAGFYAPDASDRLFKDSFE